VKSNFRLFSTIIGTLLISSSVGATAISDTIPQDRYHFSVTYSSFLNTFWGPQVGHSYRLSEMWDIGLETGIILLHPQNTKTLFQGYRLRPSINYVLAKRKKNTYTVGLFYHHRHTIIPKERKTAKAGGQYLEFIEGEWRNSLNGLGIMFSFKEKSKKIIYTSGLGLCACYNTNRYDPEVLRFNGREEGFFWNSFFTERHELSPRLIYTMSIGF
jgi:hypothetical protein